MGILPLSITDLGGCYCTKQPHAILHFNPTFLVFERLIWRLVGRSEDLLMDLLLSLAKVAISRSIITRSSTAVYNEEERTDGLSIPLCAFQGMVSLHAPTTGKTLSLSTYEISGEGCKITPVAKKVEVYRSKSVGHEPSAEDTPGNLADTSVKIHLEVLEICENEEALDTVSIVSNISQSSAQARSPSLRYSRRENRFVSVDLAESASYSLIIPTGHSGSDINISIPDT
eukprot:g46566.t1